MSINSQNFAVGIVPTIAMPVTTAAATTTNGTAIDLEATGAPIGNEVGFLGLATTVGTSVVWKLQSSPDNSTWTDISGAASPVLTAAGVFALSIGRSKLATRYVRIVATTLGSGNVVSAVYTPYQLAEAPHYGKINGTDFVALGN